MLNACKQIATDFGLWRRLRRISLESEIWLFGFFMLQNDFVEHDTECERKNVSCNEKCQSYYE